MGGNPKHRRLETTTKELFQPRHAAHEWFDAWRAGLPLLGVSYEQGTAAHLDVSYRSTKAMLKNKMTDTNEFRRMIERDVAWSFRLLPLCENLRLLLTFGPIVRADGTCESLLEFLQTAAPRHGFTVFQDGESSVLEHRATRRRFFAHDVSNPRASDVAATVLIFFRTHRHQLAKRIALRTSDPLL